MREKIMIATIHTDSEVIDFYIPHQLNRAEPIDTRTKNMDQFTFFFYTKIH